MNFAIKIKEKSFTNKHNNSQIKVLKNIDINIKQKSLFALWGYQDGKTTLMNMIGGLIKTIIRLYNLIMIKHYLMKNLICFSNLLLPKQ